MTPSEVSDWIESAPFAELLTTLRAGLARRDDAPRDDGHGYVVGLAIGADDGGGWELSMAAPPDATAYDDVPPDGEPWCQFGACPSCGLELTGAVKRALCPYCGARARLT